MNPKELTICHMIKNGTILLIKEETGVNKGKWNAPSGEVAAGEKPEKSAIRNVFQQTGLYVNKALHHGTIRLFLNGKVEYSYKLHVFSSKVFTGNVKPNVAGETRWFNASEIPFYEMWADDKYWMNLILQGKKFDADFFFDEKNENIVKYQIREKKEVLNKYIPVIVAIGIVALLLFGIVRSGVLNKKTQTQFTPPANVVKTTATTTAVTTTIPSPPINPPASGPVASANTSYIYYIVYSGTPPSEQTYYSVVNSSGISNWRLLNGNPVNLKSASCIVYSSYVYCTGGPDPTATTTANASANQPANNTIRVGNPACLELHPQNTSICYNTYQK
jgi:ADP-ribose pyrophosphatase YjhB (NUDIX family)